MSNNCNDPNERDSIQALLDGTYGPLGWSSISNARDHLQQCAACQYEFPDAEAHLNRLQSNLEADIRQEITRFRHEYLASKHKILAAQPDVNEGAAKIPVVNSRVPSNSPTPASFSFGPDPRVKFERKAWCLILACLLRHGDNIQDDLAFIHEFGGLAEFTYFPVEGDGEEDIATANSWRFIDTFDSATRAFICAALWAYELLIHLRRRTGASRPVEEIPIEVTDSNFAEAISDTAIDPRALLALAEGSHSSVHSTAESIRPEQGTRSKGGISTHDDALQLLRREIMGHLEDFSDSFKATQMHMVNLLEDRSIDPWALDPKLRAEIGEDIYGQLTVRTRELLQHGESAFLHAREPPGFNSAVMYFCSAYEREFRARIVTVLFRELAKMGFKDYPVDEVERRRMILVSARANDRLELGTVLHYLRHPAHRKLREILEHIGVDVTQLIDDASRIKDERNPVAHGSSFTDKSTAARLRDLIFGSALKNLLSRPARGPATNPSV
jgi:hypothetical protein